MQYLYKSIRIGAGYDRLSGEFKKNCMVKINSPIAFEFSDKKEFQLLKIEELSQLAWAMELPKTALLPGSPHGLLREKYHFFKSITFNRFNHFILAKAKITHTENNIGDSILKEKYIGYLKENGISQFIERCGNSYLSKYSMGMEYFFLFEFESNTVQEHEKLSSLFESLDKHSFGYEEFFEVLLSFRNLNAKKIDIFRHGDILNLDNPKQKQLANILNRIKSEMLNKELKPHSFTYSPYPAFIHKSSSHPNKKTLETVLDYYATNQETLLDLNYIGSHPNKFNLSNIETKLTDWKSQANYNLSYLSRLFSRCSHVLETCSEPGKKFLFTPIPKNLEIKHIASSHRKQNSCTTTVFKLGRGKECGVASYQQKQMPYCGVARYQKAPNKLCPGSIPPLGPQILKKGYLTLKPVDKKELKLLKLECQEKFGKDWIYSDLNPVYHGPLQGSQKVEGQPGYHTCIRLAKIVSCRHPSHGVEAYKKCEHPSHGVAKFKQCRLPEFGVQYRLPRSCLLR